MSSSQTCNDTTTDDLFASGIFALGATAADAQVAPSMLSALAGARAAIEVLVGPVRMDTATLRAMFMDKDMTDRLGDGLLRVMRAMTAAGCTRNDYAQWLRSLGMDDGLIEAVFSDLTPYAATAA